MWGSLKSIAERAKQAAADLEGQLDASVGIQGHGFGGGGSSSSSSSAGGVSSFLSNTISAFDGADTSSNAATTTTVPASGVRATAAALPHGDVDNAAYSNNANLDDMDDPWADEFDDADTFTVVVGKSLSINSNDNDCPVSASSPQQTAICSSQQQSAANTTTPQSLTILSKSSCNEQSVHDNEGATIMTQEEEEDNRQLMWPQNEMDGDDETMQNVDVKKHEEKEEQKESHSTTDRPSNDVTTSVASAAPLSLPHASDDDVTLLQKSSNIVEDVDECAVTSPLSSTPATSYVEQNQHQQQEKKPATTLIPDDKYCIVDYQDDNERGYKVDGLASSDLPTLADAVESEGSINVDMNPETVSSQSSEFQSLSTHEAKPAIVVKASTEEDRSGVPVSDQRTTAAQRLFEDFAIDGNSSLIELDQTALQSDNNAKEFYEQLQTIQQRLEQREQQLVSKTVQMSVIQAEFDSERQEWQDRVQSTKDEAKRRIQKAKERVEFLEERVKHQEASNMNSSSQLELMASLRAEGEKLAMRQLEMEKAVRAAKSEARELRASLQDESLAKDKAQERVEQLESELKSTKEGLVIARQGESQAEKLNIELRTAKEECERKSSTILTLQQEVKELKAESKDLMSKLELAKKGALVHSEREQKRLRKDHQDTVADLEYKLGISEKEASMREDALRHEIAELRKRWQDAVGRADSLSMDVQSSSAPLLRQLESMEKQNRARTAAWAELENKLRTELEETVIANEELTKERSDLKTRCSGLERSDKDIQSQLKSTKIDLEGKTAKVQKLETNLEEIQRDQARLKERYAEVERLANEGVSRVRSEMTQNMVDGEERYRSQLRSLKNELRQELDKRGELERQVQSLVNNAGVMTHTHSTEILLAGQHKDEPQKKLQRSENQADILAGALGAFAGDEDETDIDDESDEEVDADGFTSVRMRGHGSFAALEQLNSRLKVARVELIALKKSLAESERYREELMAEQNELRHAKEKLPLFEAKVAELSLENRELNLEVQGLQDDVTEMKELYRTHMNTWFGDTLAPPELTEVDGKDYEATNGSSLQLLSP